MSNNTIRHISDFAKYIEKSTDGYRSSLNLLFRGEGNKAYKLLPSLYREHNNGFFSYQKYLEISTEQRIIQDFMTNAASYISTIQYEDKFSWVEYAQHFGVPTRLMDWTANPLTALYFACLSSQDTDGRVYMLNASFYQQISNRNDINKMKGKSIKQEASKMIWNNQKTFPWPILFRPYYFDNRMRVQSSWFMVWGYYTIPLNEIVVKLEEAGQGKLIRDIREKGFSGTVDWEGTALEQVIIPKDCKKQLLHELDRFGVNNASLFPGLDGIGATVEWKNNAMNVDEGELI